MPSVLTFLRSVPWSASIPVIAVVVGWYFNEQSKKRERMYNRRLEAYINLLNYSDELIKQVLDGERKQTLFPETSKIMVPVMLWGTEEINKIASDLVKLAQEFNQRAWMEENLINFESKDEEEQAMLDSDIEWSYIEELQEFHNKFLKQARIDLGIKGKHPDWYDSLN